MTTIAHQLHGAIGVTLEHQLWLATMRARSWADEFGTTGQHATRLGRMALAADDPWTLVVGLPRALGVEHLGHPGLHHVGVATSVRSMPKVAVSASMHLTAVSKRIFSVSAGPVDGEVAAAQVPPRVVGHQRRGQARRRRATRDGSRRTNCRLRDRFGGCGFSVNT